LGEIAGRKSERSSGMAGDITGEEENSPVEFCLDLDLDVYGM
jgi:hypothetical protein